MKKINWGKLYDKQCACLQCNTVPFCGCRWDDINECYDCLNEAVKDKNFLQKLWVLIQLKYGSFINWVVFQYRKFKN